MTDPISAITALGSAGSAADTFATEAAKTGASLWNKVLGPPAEALGEHLRSRMEAWSKDSLASRVLRRAAAKVDTTESGTVPPRVASDIFEKAQWAEDEFVAEYLSGVLASARTPEGKDDSGVAWTALVGRLSSAQLRLHYILYSTARHLLVGRSIEAINDLELLPVLVPVEPVIDLLGGDQQGADAFNESIMNLTREGLLSDNFQIDVEGHQTSTGAVPPGSLALVYRMTSAGVMLFLRGGGSRVTLIRSFLDTDIDAVFDPPENIPVPIPDSGLYFGPLEPADQPQSS